MRARGPLAGGSRAGAGPDAIGLHAARDVLELAPAHVLETVGQVPVYMLVDCLRDADAAGVGDALQARGHIHAIAEHVVVVGDDVREVDADAEAHPLVFRCRGVARLAFRLHVDGEGHGIHNTRKLGQEAIAQGLDHPAAMTQQQRIDDGQLPVHQLVQGAGLVLFHQPRVSRHIGRKNCCQTPFQRPRGSLSQWQHC